MAAKRRRVLAVVGGVVGAGALTGAAVMAFGPSSDGVPAAAAPAAAVESACGLPGTTEGLPGSPKGTTAATAARWEPAGAYMLPVSDTDGPGVRGAGAWSCYTRTPSGAVLAGLVIPWRASGAAEDWQHVIRTQTLPGAGQDAALAAGLGNPELVTVRGYDLAAYSPDRVTIRYYLHTAKMDATCSEDLVWSDGDWRLVLGEDGSTSSGCTRGAPERFTPWGP